MITWLTPSLAALFSFGLWGIFTKLSVDYIDVKSALVYQTLGVLVVGLIGLGFMDFRPMANARGFSFGLLTGIAYAVGCLFYFIAASRGKIITVVTITALYPLITILLSYFIFKDTVTLKQGFGILLAVGAIVLLSS